MKTLDVWLLGEKCGALIQTPQGDLKFSYFSGYSGTPLSLSMPTARQTHPKSVILPFLQGLLPDNSDAIRAISRRFGVSPNNPFALLEHIGLDVAGALEFRSEEGAQPASLHLSEAAVAALLNQQIEEYATGNPGVGSGQFSLAGAQPKIALHLDRSGQWWTSSSEKPSTHILKPVPSQLPGIHLAEHLTMSLARELGLNASFSSIAFFGGLEVFVTTRYDRQWSAGKVVRRHQEDLCQSLSVAPTQKYQRYEGGPGVGRIARLFRSLPGQSRAEVSTAFYSGLVFNTLVRATDAHAKNYSLLLDGLNVQLAPFYDLISGSMLGTARESAMSIGGEYLFSKITDKGLIEEGKVLDVVDPAEIVAEMRDTLPAALAKAESSVLKELPSQEADIEALSSRLRASL